MKFSFLIIEAWQALRSNLLRSLLTIIGIVVGIFSVTAMLALGAGLSANVLESFNSFAQGDLTLSGKVTDADRRWLEDQGYVLYSLATKQINDTEVIAFGTEFSPSVQSVVGNYLDIIKYEVVVGEVFDFSSTSENRAVVLVSESLADTVSKETGQAILGQGLIINGIKFEVIGVINANAFTFSLGDGVVLIPYARTVGILSDNPFFSSLSVVLKDSSTFEITGAHILSSLNTARLLAPDSDEAFSLETSQSFIETAKETTAMLTIFLGVVGGIALFVGGIGTMNMMLTTITERTREIGLRKAIGARNRDILFQILIESVMLTSLGGSFGILLTLIIAEIANQIFADSEIIRILVNLNVVLVAALVSVVVGIVFGLYPARRASKLQPVDALRSE